MSRVRVPLLAPLRVIVTEDRIDSLALASGSMSGGDKPPHFAEPRLMRPSLFHLLPSPGASRISRAVMQSVRYCSYIWAARLRRVDDEAWEPGRATDGMIPGGIRMAP
jgi:hypothetical protein